MATNRGGRPRWKIPAASAEVFDGCRANRPASTPTRPRRDTRRHAQVIEFFR